MSFDCKQCESYWSCEMPIELGFMNGGCRAFKEKKPVTNYNRFINNSPDEIAGLVCGGCPPVDRCFYGDEEEELEPNCFKCWLDWLMQEAK